MFPDRHHVQQGLGGVLMSAVTGIDHRRTDILTEQMGRAGKRVAQDDNIRVHGRDIAGRINQGFALGRGAGGGGDVKGIRAHPLGRDLKREAGTGGRLEKKIDDGIAAQGGNLFYRAGGNLFEGLRRIQDVINIIGREVFHVEDVPMRKKIAGSHSENSQCKINLRAAQERCLPDTLCIFAIIIRC